MLSTVARTARTTRCRCRLTDSQTTGKTNSRLRTLKLGPPAWRVNPMATQSRTGISVNASGCSLPQGTARQRPNNVTCASKAILNPSSASVAGLKIAAAITTRNKVTDRGSWLITTRPRTPSRPKIRSIQSARDVSPAEVRRRLVCPGLVDCEPRLGDVRPGGMAPVGGRSSPAGAARRNTRSGLFDPRYRLSLCPPGTEKKSPGLLQGHCPQCRPPRQRAGNATQPLPLVRRCEKIKHASDAALQQTPECPLRTPRAHPPGSKGDGSRRAPDPQDEPWRHRAVRAGGPGVRGGGHDPPLARGAGVQRFQRASSPPARPSRSTTRPGA